MIGCQLRYHSGLSYIKILEKKTLGKIYSVFCDVGEHLPYWHPNENYKKSYAAKKARGGVVLTLIHEIDYLYWLFENLKVFTRQEEVLQSSILMLRIQC